MTGASPAGEGETEGAGEGLDAASNTNKSNAGIGIVVRADCTTGRLAVSGATPDGRAGAVEDGLSSPHGGAVPLKAGIVGLSMVGKSTLFQLLTGASPAPPGGRPEPRLGVARVPDSRVDALARIYAPRKTTPATVEYVDVPGVAKGEGSALVDLPALRGVDVLVHVVRAFESELAPHPDGSVDPPRDARMFDLELILADLGAVEKRLEKLEANIKKLNRAEDVAERGLFAKMKSALEAEKPLRELTLDEEDRRRLRAILSTEPVPAAITEAMAILGRAGSEAFTRARAREHRDEAIAQLEASGVVDGEAMERLKRIVSAAIAA